MFLYRVKIEELETARLIALKGDLERGEENLRAQCPIREMSVVSEAHDHELDIYLALDDSLESDQLRRLADEIDTLLGTARPRVSAELIHI